MRDVEIRETSIRLGQFLKLAGLADDGGRAKDALAAGAVTVNGEPEGRRGRQLHDGDVVVLTGQDEPVRCRAGASGRPSPGASAAR